jgi:hypothetical protein
MNLAEQLRSTGGVVVPLVPPISADRLAAAVARAGACLVIASHPDAERVEEVSGQLSVSCCSGRFERVAPVIGMTRGAGRV